MAFANRPGHLQPGTVTAPLHMVDIMPTSLGLAGGNGSPNHPMDGKDIWPTLASGAPSPNQDILINVEAFRGAVRKGDWKLLKIALLPGKTELFDLSKDPGETTDVAAQHPEIAADLEARLLTCEAAEAKRVDQGPAGVRRQPGSYGLRPGLQHRRRWPATRKGNED